MPDTEAPVAPAKTREQVVAQYRAVAHLARQIALVHEQIADIYAHPDATMEVGLIDLAGSRSASRMEALGDMLNSMDAVDPADDWLTPIFHVAQATWPQS